jgi:hypothetical protein
VAALRKTIIDIIGNHSLTPQVHDALAQVRLLLSIDSNSYISTRSSLAILRCSSSRRS